MKYICDKGGIMELTISKSLRKAKPIFAEERDFIHRHLDIDIPKDCWITGGGTKFVWLDLYSKEPLIKFKVDVGGKWILLKDNREKLKDYQAKTVDDTLEIEHQRVENQYEESVNKTVEFVKQHSDIKYTISISGGKDSEVLRNVWNDMLERINFVPNYEFIFFNTTNEAASVYKYIKKHPEIKIINPEISWRKWIEKNNYFMPSINQRACCSVYKEGQALKINDKNSSLVQVLGVRNKESNKRAGYEFYMDYDFNCRLRGTSNLPKLWSKLCPIVDFETVDIWLLMLTKNFEINERYRLGESRVGCLICPYSNSYEEEIFNENYPYAKKWLYDCLEKNYNNHDFVKTLGWTIDEWKVGRWKRSTDKWAEFLSSKPTPEKIHEFAVAKGLTDKMAAKFWHNKCSCGQNLSRVNKSMYYKVYGRFENIDDERIPLCRKCFCKEQNITIEEYLKQATEYKESGCKLF